MLTMDNLTTFLGWCTAINAGILLLVLVFFTIYYEWVGKLSARLFGIANDEAKAALFHIFQQYQQAFAILNAVPFLAGIIMA